MPSGVNATSVFVSDRTWTNGSTVDGDSDTFLSVLLPPFGNGLTPAWLGTAYGITADAVPSGSRRPAGASAHGVTAYRFVLDGCWSLLSWAGVCVGILFDTSLCVSVRCWKCLVSAWECLLLARECLRSAWYVLRATWNILRTASNDTLLASSDLWSAVHAWVLCERRPWIAHARDVISLLGRLTPYTGSALIVACLVTALTLVTSKWRLYGEQRRVSVVQGRKVPRRLSENPPRYTGAFQTGCSSLPESTWILCHGSSFAFVATSPVVASVVTDGRRVGVLRTLLSNGPHFPFPTRSTTGHDPQGR